MPKTMFELEERMSDLRSQITMESDALMTMASDAGAKMEDLRTKKQRVADLKERLELLNGEHAAMEKAAKEKMGNGGSGATMTRAEAAGLYFKAALTGGDVRSLPTMAYEQLGAIPAANADQGYGSNLIPKQLANGLLLEPKIKNPLRERMTVTQVAGLELPKMSFTADDTAFQAKSGATAKELKLDASGLVTFGRHKMHLNAKVSESLLRSSPVDIAGAVNGELESAQASKELSVIFAASPATGEEDMSFYTKNSSSKYLVTAVEGDTLLDAILAAFADLEDDYQDNAAVVMTRQAYYGMVRTLSGHDNLFGKKPEDVIGYPVIFCAKATVPVVGDFSYLHLNYDCAPWYDTDKDVTNGLQIFSSTALYDIKIKMRSAFRLATVKAAASGT